MPSRPITSLIFVSTATPGIDRDDFLAIMTVAQRNSQRFGMTGLLVCNGFNFMQCIEGDRAAVNDRLHRIGADDRHNGMTVLSHIETHSRQFGQLHMAGQYFPVQNGCAQADLSQILTDDSVTDVARTLFRSFDSLGTRITG